MTTVSLFYNSEIYLFITMVLKASFQLAFLAIEVFLTFYSNVLEDSLIVRFLLFVITAVLIAMAVTKLANNLLPADKDFVSDEETADY